MNTKGGRARIYWEHQDIPLKRSRSFVRLWGVSELVGLLYLIGTPSCCYYYHHQAYGSVIIEALTTFFFQVLFSSIHKTTRKIKNPWPKRLKKKTMNENHQRPMYILTDGSIGALLLLFLFPPHRPITFLGAIT